MKRAVTVFCFLTSLLFSQETGFLFASGPLLFKPFVAQTFEPRVGLVWHSDRNRLRLDIGNSVDLIQYQSEKTTRRITIGADFFTYTLLRGEKNFHFPVDAVDYLFGFNVNYVDTLKDGIFSSRFRLSHISAHFVDGHYDNTQRIWKDGISPQVYSREFFDLAVAFEPNEQFRGYVGAVYVFHVDPTTLPKFYGYIGGEVHKEFLRDLNGYVAYQFTPTGLRPRNEIQVGTKIGNWYRRGVQVYFLHYIGNSIQGEYHDMQDEYSGIAFTIDF
ncbi:MAG: hypothetical protein PHP42_03510 [Bacteroidota bacterium]|nr:hypothetical protein [Bacteroidota bacterium]